MKSVFRSILLILSLVVFFTPNTSVYAQNTNEVSCCKSEKSECHKEHHKDKKHSKKTSEHRKDCCNTSVSSCIGCANVLFLNDKSEMFLFSDIYTYQNHNFLYKAPALELVVSKIWQPPKIG